MSILMRKSAMIDPHRTIIIMLIIMLIIITIIPVIIRTIINETLKIIRTTIT
jgi:hypothetical protein